MYIILGLVFLLIVAAIVIWSMITAWWLWQKAITPGGEPAPKWGELHSLMQAARNPSLTFRLITVALLAGIMTLPMFWIDNLVNERFRRYNSVVAEISSIWGAVQTVTGPILSIPYTVQYQTVEEIPLSAAEIAFEQSRGSERTTTEVVRNHEEERIALLLPGELFIDGQIATETRYRGIYSVRVYTADVEISGNFTRYDLTGLRPNITEVHWNRAVLVVGVTNTRAIRGISELEIAGVNSNFQPGTGGMRVLPTGFSSPCDLSMVAEGEKLDFRFNVSIGGSGGFFMTPLGISSTLTLASDWPHPSFTGSGLPTSREIDASGFTALWNVPNLVRNYPQMGDMHDWSAADAARGTPGHRIHEYVVGVEFVEPVFHYSLITRATKYALLFIALTFLGVVIFENYYSRRGGVMLSMAQYAVIGAGLALFYLTLLAASEHVGFTAAYMIATVQSVIMTSGYVAAAMRQLRPALMIAFVQSLLYVMLFLILRMEDHALLAGTALLVAGTVALMAVTSGINKPKAGI